LFVCQRPNNTLGIRLYVDDLYIPIAIGEATDQVIAKGYMLKAIIGMPL
jgi:hypothetical protein